jgi:hypothetical protein
MHGMWVKRKELDLEERENIFNDTIRAGIKPALFSSLLLQDS